MHTVAVPARGLHPDAAPRRPPRALTCACTIRRDCGSAVAARAARLSVMPLEGGQAQFVVHDYTPMARGSPSNSPSPTSPPTPG